MLKARIYDARQLPAYLSPAQYAELMSIDKPLTLYGKKKDTPDEEDILEAQERWEKKYGDKKDKSVDAKPLLSNFNIK